MKKEYTSSKKTKEKILSAAYQLFAEKGYEGATTRQIAALSGQKLFSISYHFTSKEQLYSAVIDNIINTIKSSKVVIDDPDVSKDMGFVQLMTIVGNMVQGSLGKDGETNGPVILREQYHPTVNFSKLSKGIIEPIQNGIEIALANAVGRPDLVGTREFQLHSHLIHSLSLSYRTFRETLKSRLNITELNDSDKHELIKVVSFEVESIVKGLRNKYGTE